MCAVFARSGRWVFRTIAIHLYASYTMFMCFCLCLCSEIQVRYMPSQHKYSYPEYKGNDYVCLHAVHIKAYIYIHTHVQYSHSTSAEHHIIQSTHNVYARELTPPVCGVACDFFSSFCCSFYILLLSRLKYNATEQNNT